MKHFFSPSVDKLHFNIKKNIFLLSARSKNHHVSDALLAKRCSSKVLFFPSKILEEGTFDKSEKCAARAIDQLAYTYYWLK